MRSEISYVGLWLDYTGEGLVAAARAVGKPNNSLAMGIARRICPPWTIPLAAHLGIPHDVLCNVHPLDPSVREYRVRALLRAAKRRLDHPRHELKRGPRGPRSETVKRPPRSETVKRPPLSQREFSERVKRGLAALPTELLSERVRQGWHTRRANAAAAMPDAGREAAD